MATLNDRILAYLASKSIAPQPEDFQCEQEGDAPESIAVWNTNNLGARPTADDLAAMDAILAKQGLIDHAASVRYAKEISGIPVTVGAEADVPLSTARGNDRAVLIATMVAIGGGFRSDAATFKFADNKSRVASNADMQAAILAALAHVQGVFDVETQAQADINAGTLTTKAAIDARFA